jgi:acyl carrier protein
MGQLNHDEVIAELIGIVNQVLGPDMAMILEVRADSSFVRDLEMDSIQIVAVAQKLQERYGVQNDLMSWLSKQSLRHLMTMTLADVAAHVA